MTKPILLDSNEAAMRLGTTRRQVQRLAKAGLLPVHTFGARGVLFFRKSDVDRSPTSVA